MAVIKLISWHPEAAAKAALLERAKMTVDAAPLVRTSAVIGEMAALNPAALVLDMDRRPSHAREIALALRASKSARHIPILFAGALPAASGDGLPEQFARLRSELPDIPYAAWPDARKVLAAMLKQPKTAPPIVPQPRVYTASLAQKLGIVATTPKAAQRSRQVALVAAPEGFGELLGDLPETVKLTGRIGKETDLALCFIRSLGDLAATLDMLTLRLPDKASAWIVYPKRAARMGEAFHENDVRRLGLAEGLVDYKICSVDAAWSGMKFAWRRDAAHGRFR